jgi:hypothetical protein
MARRETRHHGIQFAIDRRAEPIHPDCQKNRVADSRATADR